MRTRRQMSALSTGAKGGFTLGCVATLWLLAGSGKPGWSCIATAQEPATIRWKREGTAAWQPRDSQAEYAFDGKLWIGGGWFDSFSPPPRDVWSSADGKTWNQVTAAAPWLHSDLPMNTTFAGKMWLLGGWYNGRLPGHSASNQV